MAIMIHLKDGTLQKSRSAIQRISVRMITTNNINCELECKVRGTINLFINISLIIR